MLQCLKYYKRMLSYHSLRFIIRMSCNLIRNQEKRKSTRNALYKKYCNPIRTIFISEVDNHLPKKVLAQINSVDNEYFIAQNAKIATGGGGL